MFVNFDDLQANPDEECRKMQEFVGFGDYSKAAKLVQSKLNRSKPEDIENVLWEDAEFVYISNWKSPGSWSVTLYADEIKIIYNPLEKGIIFENKGKIEIHPSSEDSKFKPGFYGLWNHFIKNHIEKKLFNWPESDLADHKSSIQLVEEIYKVNN